MLNHVMVGSNDIERSKTFYNAVLGVVGAGEPMVHVNDTGHTRLFYNHNGDTFGVVEPINDQPANPANGATLGIKCESMEQVQELHDVAIANGGTSIEDPPGPRSGNMGVMNLCYFTDPDGHKWCGIHRPEQ